MMSYGLGAARFLAAFVVLPLLFVPYLEYDYEYLRMDSETRRSDL
jgi:hypothetical protein